MNTEKMHHDPQHERYRRDASGAPGKVGTGAPSQGGLA